MKLKMHWAYIVGVIAIAGIGYALYHYSKGKAKNTQTAATGGKPTPKQDPPAAKKQAPTVTEILAGNANLITVKKDTPAVAAAKKDVIATAFAGGNGKKFGEALAIAKKQGTSGISWTPGGKDASKIKGGNCAPYLWGPDTDTGEYGPYARNPKYDAKTCGKHPDDK